MREPVRVVGSGAVVHGCQEHLGGRRGLIHTTPIVLLRFRRQVAVISASPFAATRMSGLGRLAVLALGHRHVFVDRRGFADGLVIAAISPWAGSIVTAPFDGCWVIFCADC